MTCITEFLNGYSVFTRAAQQPARMKIPAFALRHKYWAAAAVGLLIAVSLIAISEVGYRRSVHALSAQEAVRDLQRATSKLGYSLKTTESAQRGYLITGEAFFLDQYRTESSETRDALASLKQALGSASGIRFDVSALESGIATKMTEMDMAVHLRAKGHVDASRFVTSNDAGRVRTDGATQLLTELDAATTALTKQSEAQIHDTQEHSRASLTLAAVAGLMAFWLYLQSSHQLQAAIARSNHALLQERERLEHLVRERTSSLRELATHLQQVREVDRARLARELHDEMGALLTAARLCLGRMKARLAPDNEQMRPLVLSLGDTMSQLIAIKRNIIEDLRPSALDNFGLLVALEILTREFQQHAGVTVEADLEPADLSADAQLSLYRMVQESLTNVAKYAQAANVYVGLRVYRAHVELTVRDDGVGFDQAVTKPKSHGLAGIRHRVESLGGRLDVHSQPGRGTSIVAVFPTATNAPANAAPVASEAMPVAALSVVPAARAIPNAG